MDKYEQAQKLSLLLECAESGIMVKDIPGYEGRYAITSDGRVYSYCHNIFLKPNDNGHGYLRVLLFKDSQKKTKRINRLVAEAFVPKPEGWDNSWDAAHKDDNRSNNDYRNLIWQTRADNINTDHFRNARTEYGPTPVRCVETGIEYASQAAAARDLDICAKSISNVINGYQITAGSYHWEKIEPKAAENCDN